LNKFKIINILIVNVKEISLKDPGNLNGLSVIGTQIYRYCFRPTSPIG